MSSSLKNRSDISRHSAGLYAQAIIVLSMNWCLRREHQFEQG